MELQLSDINTALPGVVVSYNAANCRATVKSTLPKKLADGSTLAAPAIVNVPICFPQADINGSLAQITVPVKAGDGVLLIFSQRSLENWLSGEGTAPDDPRMFDLSDAFALLGANQKTLSADPDNVTIRYGSGNIKIAPNGNITATTTLFTINGDVQLNGKLTSTGDQVAGGISTINHKHKGDSGGITGVPQ